MTASGLFEGVLGPLFGFIPWFAVILLGFAVLQMIGGRSR